MRPDGDGETPPHMRPDGDGGTPPHMRPDGDGETPPHMRPDGDGGTPPHMRPDGDGGTPPHMRPDGDGGTPPHMRPDGDGGTPPHMRPDGDGGTPPHMRPDGDGGTPPHMRPDGDGGPPPHMRPDGDGGTPIGGKPADATDAASPSGPGAVDTSRRPFVLVWEVTQACDLACKHCRADAQPERHPGELTTAEGKALLDSAREFGEGQLVVLSGGDPMARPDAVELVRYGVDRGLRMTLTPSGTASLTGADVEALADAGLRRMALSIDGVGESHDEFRGEDGSFAETLRVARQAREAGLPLQVNTTVCAETVGDLPAIRDLAAELGAVLWSVFFLVPVGRGAVLDPISPDRAERVVEWLVEVNRESPFGVKTTEAPHYRRVVAQQRRRGDGRAGGTDDAPPDDIGRRTGITAGDGFAFVSHVGEVYPSGFLPQSAGTVREQRVVEIYRNADLFRELRDPDALRGKCGACPFRNLCGGSRSRAFAYTGDPLESDPLCPYVPEGYDGPLPETLAGE